MFLGGIFIIVILLIATFCIAVVVQWMLSKSKNSKNESLEQDLVTIVSHELRTPLTSIKLYTEMLSANPNVAQNKELRLYTTNIGIAIEKMGRIINNLLNVSCIESGRLRVQPIKTNLSSALRNIIKGMKPLAELHHSRIIFHENKQVLPMIAMDQDLLFHIISNLLTNAIKYGRPKHGRIEIRLEKTVVEKNRFIEIVIQDNGIGISPEDQRHVFQKFYRAKNATDVETEGTGVGLFVTKRMVELTGGKIRFTSEQDIGTTFTIRFPVTGMKAMINSESLSHTDKHG